PALQSSPLRLAPKLGYYGFLPATRPRSPLHPFPLHRPSHSESPASLHRQPPCRREPFAPLPVCRLLPLNRRPAALPPPRAFPSNRQAQSRPTPSLHS